MIRYLDIATYPSCCSYERRLLNGLQHKFVQVDRVEHRRNNYHKASVLVAFCVSGVKPEDTRFTEPQTIQ